MYIGEQIRRCRNNLKMTQEALAAILYVTPQAVSQWERGITIPDTDKLSEIAAALHTTVNALIGTVTSSLDWVLLDSLFSSEHMYSRMTVFAEVEQLNNTSKALRFITVPGRTLPLLQTCLSAFVVHTNNRNHTNFYFSVDSRLFHHKHIIMFCQFQVFFSKK